MTFRQLSQNVWRSRVSSNGVAPGLDVACTQPSTRSSPAGVRRFGVNRREFFYSLMMKKKCGISLAEMTC